MKKIGVLVATTTLETLHLPLFESLKKEALLCKPFFCRSGRVVKGQLPTLLGRHQVSPNADACINALVDLHQFLMPLVMALEIIFDLPMWCKSVGSDYLS
ncbi:hypothetical protein Csa_002285 [Cucumis sativus]|uniref:Uncharacterized protein n=1 Tax=Cucumis sativus TaxID=3659 RepID=A0A0A0LD71_CUCSA|nr:hypothetical protein Csa_002285 [Cucumis sativus]